MYYFDNFIENIYISISYNYFSFHNHIIYKFNFPFEKIRSGNEILRF